MADMAGVPVPRMDVSTPSIGMDAPPFAELQNFAQEIFDTAREPLLVLDAALRVRSANSSFYRMFKVSAPETLNRLVYELGNGQWGLPALRTLLEEIIPDSSFFGEFVLEHDFPVIGRRVMLLDARRLEPGLVLLAVEDVTERRQSQHLVNQIEHAQDVVDTVREPLLILDGKLRVHSANRAFYQTFNVTAADTETRLVYELGNGQWNIPDLRTLLEDILPMSSVFNDYELEHDFPEIGRRIMLLNARQLRQGSHAEFLVLAMEDVTERRRVETEVAKAKEAAETANRTKSLFLANMSHELRTPLNAILGFSEMLQDEAAERNLEEFNVDLQKITTAGRHLLGLINDILDLSKIEAGKMELHLEAFDVAALLAEVATTIERQAARNGNTLEVTCAPDIGVMWADLSKVRQGLFNLVSNAAKFTHDGRISVLAERQLVDGSDWIMFRVSDTGIGLDAEQLVRLFQPFTQADASTTRKFGGTGLGLALTRRFCQMMNGDVMVQSVSGEGSVFTLLLPATVYGALPAPAVPESRRVDDVHDAEPLPPLGTSVLVIDDDPLQRDLMQRYLQKEGFTVRVASGGADGLQLARRIRPAAITLDVMMPGMDGWSVLSALKGDVALRDIPVIMLTMVDDPVRGFTLGASDYATKPVNRRRLSQILKKFTCRRPPCPVLIIDDDAMTRSLTRTIMEKEGWKVSEAENGIEALKSMEKNRPSLIFLDLLMPEMDGFAFAAEVRMRPEWRSIPIVVVTSQDLTTEDRRRLNGHVETILRKHGDSREALLEQVRDLLAGSNVRRVPRNPEEVAR
jgi:signal transduction histidine kinase/DNA-binding response OmpR family regulator